MQTANTPFQTRRRKVRYYRKGRLCEAGILIIGRETVADPCIHTLDTKAQVIREQQRHTTDTTGR